MKRNVTNLFVHFLTKNIKLVLTTTSIQEYSNFKIKKTQRKDKDKEKRYY